MRDLVWELNLHPGSFPDHDKASYKTWQPYPRNCFRTGVMWPFYFGTFLAKYGNVSGKPKSGMGYVTVMDALTWVRIYVTSDIGKLVYAACFSIFWDFARWCWIYGYNRCIENQRELYECNRCIEIRAQLYYMYKGGCIDVSEHFCDVWYWEACLCSMFQHFLRLCPAMLDILLQQMCWDPCATVSYVQWDISSKILMAVNFMSRKG